jgi:hypothetical protein
MELMLGSSVLGIKHRALCTPGKCCTTELHLQQCLGVSVLLYPTAYLFLDRNHNEQSTNAHNAKSSNAEQEKQGEKLTQKV